MTSQPVAASPVRTIAVTGAYGLVGSHCVRRLEAGGKDVRRFAHARRAPDDVVFNLGHPVDPALFDGVDALIHTAYAFGLEWDDLRRINVAGSEQLLRAAHAAGVRRLVFISSVSAFEGCRSSYGQGKLLVEQAIREFGGIALRPGLVYGEHEKGMFGALARLTRRLPILPVFDGGRQPMRLVHVEDLAAVIAEALSWDPAAIEAPAIVAHPRIVTFRTILETIAARQRRSIGFVSLPGNTVAAALGALERIGLRPPFGRDNLVGLLHPDPELARISPLVTGCRDFVSVQAEEMGVSHL